MDNHQQMEEIKKYWIFLCQSTGEKIDLEIAANLWIEKFAPSWRQENPFPQRRKESASHSL